jgi:hypothetical protein
MYVGRRSMMTPVEGAYYLGIPNMLMIQTNVDGQTRYERYFEPPYDQYMIGLRPMKRVEWALTGSGGCTSPEYREKIMALSKRSPNCVGLYLDDFFHEKPGGKRAALTLDELKEVRQQAQGSEKKLDIWVTYYTLLLDLPFADYLNLIDVITLWTWKHEELKNLEANFDKLDRLLPGKRKTLGCYFYDFPSRTPVPVAEMQAQCELGLKWLRAGRIEGIVFLGNSVEDLGFESVEWTRRWIADVGDTRI